MISKFQIQESFNHYARLFFIRVIFAWLFPVLKCKKKHSHIFRSVHAKTNDEENNFSCNVVQIFMKKLTKIGCYKISSPLAKSSLFFQCNSDCIAHMQISVSTTVGKYYLRIRPKIKMWPGTFAYWMFLHSLTILFLKSSQALHIVVL